MIGPAERWNQDHGTWLTCTLPSITPSARHFWVWSHWARWLISFLSFSVVYGKSDARRLESARELRACHRRHRFYVGQDTSAWYIEGVPSTSRETGRQLYESHQLPSANDTLCLTSVPGIAQYNLSGTQANISLPSAFYNTPQNKTLG